MPKAQVWPKITCFARFYLVFQWNHLPSAGRAPAFPQVTDAGLARASLQRLRVRSRTAQSIRILAKLSLHATQEGDALPPAPARNLACQRDALPPTPMRDLACQRGALPPAPARAANAEGCAARPCVERRLLRRGGLRGLVRKVARARVESRSSRVQPARVIRVRVMEHRTGKSTMPKKA